MHPGKGQVWDACYQNPKGKNNKGRGGSGHGAPNASKGGNATRNSSDGGLNKHVKTENYYHEPAVSSKPDQQQTNGTQHMDLIGQCFMQKDVKLGSSGPSHTHRDWLPWDVEGSKEHQANLADEEIDTTEKKEKQPKVSIHVTSIEHEKDKTVDCRMAPITEDCCMVGGCLVLFVQFAGFDEDITTL